ncbi:hypothetical protein [Gayadomonas joobiniege]|uniref:hypothetical protein n=1 Tax=Gayadomonas joobiniege TaxID=1234606 RepID=UPI000363EFE0|nr:hypothetical protein [Gayadomonas joobiniege]
MLAAQADKTSHTWYDSWHQQVNSSIHNSVVWFDSFFVTDKTNPQNISKSHAKFTLAYVPYETQLANFEHQFRIKAKLPNLKDRWDIIFSDYDEDDERNQADKNIAAARANRRKDNPSLALRFNRFIKDNKYLSARVGIDGGSDIYFRTRYRRTFNLTNATELEFEPALYYYLDQGYGARFNLDYNYALSSQSLLSFANGWEYIQDEPFSEWRHSLLHYYQFESNAAMVSGFFSHGLINKNDDYLVENYGLFFRYRCQTMREWLYLEIEPFVHHPQKMDYAQTFGIALRLEINFSH